MPDFSMLSNALWHEREMLEFLLFKLDEQSLLFVAGKSEWIVWAMDEVDAAVQRMRSIDLGRAVEVEGVAPALGLTNDASLLELADRAPEPWCDLLREHHSALTELTARVKVASELNRELAGSAQRSVDALIASLDPAGGDDPATYVPSGRREQAGSRPKFVDEAL